MTGYCSHSQCLHSIILSSTSFCLTFTPQDSLCLTIQPRLRDIAESEHPTQNFSWDMSGQTLSKLGISPCFFFSLSFHMAGTLRHTNQSDSQACTHWDMTQNMHSFKIYLKLFASTDHPKGKDCLLAQKQPSS